MGEVIEDPFRVARFVLELRQAGVTDEATLTAMEAVPRDTFVEETARGIAYDDCVLPIPCGQIIPRPVTTANIVSALELGMDKTKRVLVVGSGSGYLCAVVGKVADQVFGVERYHGLVSYARVRLERAGAVNVKLRHGDGLGGWAEMGPFDRIVLTGSVETVPDALYGQLTRDGFIIAPVESDEGQFVRRLRDEDRRGHVLQVSRFLPLTPGVAEVL